MVIVRTMTVLTLLVAPAACGNGGGLDTTAVPTATPRTYVVTGVTEKGAAKDLVPGTEIRLRFADGRLTLTAGCNTMSGTYTLDGTRLTVAALGMTEMGCDQARMDQDTWLGGLFARPVQLTMGEDAAVISGDTVLSLADRESVSPDRPLVGTKWLLDTVYDGQTASSVPQGVVAWVVFDENGVGVYDGCNSGQGPTTVTDERITFGDRSLTRRACIQPAAGVAGAVHQVLAGGTRFEIEETTLTIMNGSRGLGFRAVDKLPAHD